MKKIILILSLILCGQTLASLDLGIGYNSTHSGRSIPTLAGALTGSSFALSGFASGVYNSYSYHSSYGLSYFRTKKVGDLVGGEFVFGFGLGTHYAERGFQDLGATTTTKKSDYVVGPAIRLHWSIIKVMFINIDATYGLKKLGPHIFMNFQDVISTSVGVSLW